MGPARSFEGHASQAVDVRNAEGQGGIVLICDHASNAVPSDYGTLGLSEADLDRHIAWDPGAAPVARSLAAAIDAPLVESRVSRLIVDCNRPLDAPDLIPSLSETTRIAANEDLSPSERERRLELSWRPFHAAIEKLVSARLARGLPTALVSIHSFTPVYKGFERPWHIGILHDGDTRLAGPMLAGLRAEKGVVVGENQPYSPADRVYYTLERHGRARGLACAMVEIRNDLIADEAGQGEWAQRLAALLATSEASNRRSLSA